MTVNINKPSCLWRYATDLINTFILVIILRTPITTGTSVLGVKFDGGVVLAGDMLGLFRK